MKRLFLGLLFVIYAFGLSYSAHAAKDPGYRIEEITLKGHSMRYVVRFTKTGSISASDIKQLRPILGKFLKLKGCELILRDRSIRRLGVTDLYFVLKDRRGRILASSRSALSSCRTRR